MGLMVGEMPPVDRVCESGKGQAGRTESFGGQSKESRPLAALQVQFEEREDTKACTIVINDDDVFESTESFAVELSMPAYALLGNVTRATVTITDTEDEPTLQFDRKTYHVSESAGFFSAPVERKGGSRRAERLSVLPWGSAAREGSEFRSRDGVLCPSSPSFLSAALLFK